MRFAITLNKYVTGYYIDSKGDQQEYVSKVEKEITFQLLLHENISNPIKLQLSYCIEPAKWNAEYDIRLGNPILSRSNNGTVELSHGRYDVTVDYFAFVEQHTGELWEDIELKLVTAVPHTVQLLPEIQSRGVYYTGSRNRHENGRPVTLSGGSNNFYEEGISSGLGGSITLREGSVRGGLGGGLLNSVPLMLAKEDVALETAGSTSTGHVSGTHIFNIKHKVNISDDKLAKRDFSSPTRHRLLIDKVI